AVALMDRVGGGRPAADRIRAPDLATEGLVVGGIDYRHTADGQSVTDRQRGMVEELCRELSVLDLVGSLFDALEAEAGRVDRRVADAAGVVALVADEVIQRAG